MLAGLEHGKPSSYPEAAVDASPVKVDAPLSCTPSLGVVPLLAATLTRMLPVRAALRSIAEDTVRQVGPAYTGFEGSSHQPNRRRWTPYEAIHGPL